MANEIFQSLTADSTIVQLLATIFIISFIGSLIGGITGLGGGMIIKPMFSTILLMTSTIGTVVSKFISTSVVFSMSAKSVNYYQKQNVKFDYKLGFMLGFGIIVGIYAVHLVPRVGFALESLLQGILYFLVFLVVLLRDKYVKLNYRHNVVIVILIGIIIGFLASFFGIGGGAIKMPFFIVFFAMTVKEAAIYSFFASLVSEPVKLFQYGRDIIVQDQSLEALKITGIVSIVVVIAAIIGGTLGVRIQHKSNEKFVAIMFNIVILYFAFESTLTGAFMLLGWSDSPISIFNIFL